jgi:hypothetical protein
MISTPGATISAQCFTDKVDDETLGPWIDVRGCANVVFYITGSGVTSSGVITFEEAAPKDLSAQAPVVFGATTAAYSSITTNNASDVDGGKQKAVHITVAAYCFVRARISTVIGGGGSISVGLVAY